MYGTDNFNDSDPWTGIWKQCEYNKVAKLKDKLNRVAVVMETVHLKVHQ